MDDGISPKNEKFSFDRDLIQQPHMQRPHVVILGAGATLAGYPNGDRNGKKPPLMKNMVEVIGLGPLLDKVDIHNDREDFEKLYSGLVTNGRHSTLVESINEVVFNYFAEMELPAEPTLYDHLVLSLRSKDVIATFNWDPLLWQALNRNVHRRKMPRVLFLHGNTAIGYAEHDGQVLVGSHGQVSRKCGKVFARGPLLFPITEKNYQQDERIRRTWDELKSKLRAAYILTIFGYSAPVTDVEAVTLLREGWGDKHTRHMEEIEIIDIKSDDQLYKTWKPFIHNRHYRTVTSLYESTIGHSPRLSCEAMFAALMDRTPTPSNRIPQEADWRELEDWCRVLQDDERENEPPE